jgi:hypothetical protein
MARRFHSTGNRSSIRGRWLLDRPVKPGDDSIAGAMPAEKMLAPHHLSGTIAVTSTSTIIPGHASCTMLRSVWAGGGVVPKVSERHLP